MRKFNTRKFIAIFTLVVALISFVMPKIVNITYLAATVVATTESTTRKPVGHKVYGAEYYPELYDKKSVWGVDTGGGSGKGGGAGDENSSHAGNSGSYNDSGGTFGQAAGQGLGTANSTNQAGNGSGVQGGSTGSVKADVLRALKAKIEESRAESIAKILETAIDASSVAASIAERESIQESIQKKMQQESILARITAPETMKLYETPVYIEQTVMNTRKYEVTKETLNPTSRANVKIFETDKIVSPERPVVETIDYELEATIIPKSNIAYEPETIIERPTSNNITTERISEQPQYETFESPIIEEETTVTNETTIELNDDVNEDAGDKEDGAGSKGGKDAEADEDKTGDDGMIESEGHAKQRGMYQKETEGEFAGKKIFELDRNGDLGFDAEHLAMGNLKGMMISVSVLLFSLGALLFVLSNKDSFNKKNNYF